jgi:hypothetical protein
MKVRSSWVVPRSKPSAMLLETDRAARSSWERKEAGGFEGWLLGDAVDGFDEAGGFLPDGKVFETLVGHGLN